MSHYKRSGQMDMTDRVAIETGLCKGESFKEIAKRIERHPSRVSHEVQENRTHIASTYYAGKDCAKVRQCVLTGLCGASKSASPWQIKSTFIISKILPVRARFAAFCRTLRSRFSDTYYPKL